jgi:hypothetical protein
MTAVVSVPINRAGEIGSRLSTRGVPIPTREAPDVGRAYLLVPLFVLSGLGLFDQPDIEVQYFQTREEAMAWGENDIETRKQRQRPHALTLLLIEAAERVRRQ